MHTTIRHFLVLAATLAGPARAEDPWVVYEGKDGPGRGKSVVMIAADDEYRSEELIPALAKILAEKHGFRCTVLFAIDPQDGTIDPGQKDNIPGLEALDKADLLVLFARFRELPDEQMKHIIDYADSGRPIVALRTSTHAFNYSKKDSPYAKYTWTSADPKGGFGRLVLGETWVAHHGSHNVESTRGVIPKGMEGHPIVRGIGEIWGPSDVYAITELSGDSKPVVMGQVLKGMSRDDAPNAEKSLMPIAWVKTFTGASGKPSRIFVTTMGHVGDFEDEGVRRMLVNACYWAIGMESQIPDKSDVDLVGPYKPSRIGVGGHKKGIKPQDLAITE
jgi:type 1 glutamine amidotransferase